MEKIKNFQKNSLIRLDTPSEGLSVCSQQSRNSGKWRKVQKLAEEAAEIRKKRLTEEAKRNRIKLALELHQQMYEELEDAAIFIQKHIRRYLAMKKVRDLMTQEIKRKKYLLELQKDISKYWVEDFCVKHIAAYRIQRYWKGFRKYPPKLPLIQRLIKRYLDLTFLNSIKENLNLRKKSLQNLIKISQAARLAGKEKIFKQWKDFLIIEKQSPGFEIKEAEIITEPEPQIIENSRKSLKSVQENSESDSETLLKEDEKPGLENQVPAANGLKFLVSNKINQNSEFPRTKNFILSEANFHRPTLASKGKRIESPEEIVQVKKVKKFKSLKSKRLLKQTTSRLVYMNEKNQESRRREQSARPRVTSEVRLRTAHLPSQGYSGNGTVMIPVPPGLPPCAPSLPPTLPSQSSQIQSKIRENLIKRSQRSTSFTLNTKNSIPSAPAPAPAPNPESPKDQNRNPTLDFKQALPDLYSFLESYRPNIRKNQVIQSTTGLIISKLKNP